MKRGNSEKLDKSTIAVLSEYAPIEALAEYMGTMEEGMETVELTKDEAECVRWFIEDYLYTVIREDELIDNFNWIIEITNVYKKCKYLEEGGDNEAE